MIALLSGHMTSLSVIFDQLMKIFLNTQY